MNAIACKFYVYGPYGDDAWQGELRSLESVQWLEDYQSPGEVKIVCAATANNRRLLVKKNRVANTDRPGTIAVLCEVTVDSDRKRAKLTARAKISSWIWKRRVLMHTEDIKNAEAAALRIAQNNRRGLPCTVAAAKGFAAVLDTQESWGDVLTALQTICTASDLGFRHAVGADLQETLELYEGVDRTSPAGDKYVGYFGDDAGNLTKVKLLESDAEYCNVAIVAGRGEGAARTVVTVDMSGGADAIERRELFVDAKSVPEKHQTTNADGSKTDVTYTNAQYLALLRARGAEKLAEKGLVLDVSAETSERMMQPGRDYDVGDILPLQLKAYGVSMAVRVQQLRFVYEKTRTVQAVLKARK